jgi:diadenosine tetraphosphatase ApaH/serine/threonine PP2A family protein phosphatase
VKRAVLSDVHGNLEALEAVLADIEQQDISEIYCLGDIVGYGPNPCECLDLLLDVRVCVLGNHDQGALFDPEGFSSGAERAIFWTRDQLQRAGNDARNQARWNFLCELPRQHAENGYLYVHGSARNPLNEYVFPEDVYNPHKLEKIFSLISRYSFQGHTHVPGVFREQGRFQRPDELGGSIRLGPGKAMINVGSVGQPRDGDPRACYVVQEDDFVTFRRVAYPLDTTVAKIYTIAELDNFLGDRLREGC